MVREYILTERERNVIFNLINEGKRDTSTRQLKLLIERNLPVLQDDMKAIKRFMERVKE